MPNDGGAAAMRKVGNARRALDSALLAAAQEYANGGNRAEPIVRRHFTRGNAARNGWEPLAASTLRQKAAGTTKTAGGVAFLNKRQAAQVAEALGNLGALPAGARRRAHAQAVAEARGGRAASKPNPGGASLPVLVRSGRLRDAVAGGRAEVRLVQPGKVLIRWRGLPEYAAYHEEGARYMPARSPIKPNAEDRGAIIAAARRHLSASIATANRGGAATTLATGRARLA